MFRFVLNHQCNSQLLSGQTDASQLSIQMSYAILAIKNTLIQNWYYVRLKFLLMVYTSESLQYGLYVFSITFVGMIVQFALCSLEDNWNIWIHIFCSCHICFSCVCVSVAFSRWGFKWTKHISLVLILVLSYNILTISKVYELVTKPHKCQL
jgi:hypothetical protein